MVSPSHSFIVGNNTYDFTSEGENGIIYVRTSNSLVNSELTGCEVDMIGIVSQFTFDGNEVISSCQGGLRI